MKRGSLCGWVIRQWDRVRIGSTGADPRVAQEFGNDAGVTHRPSGARVQCGRTRPVLVVGPACSGGVDHGPCGEILDEEIGEVPGVAVFDDPVEGQREDPGSPAAPAVVVPEARTDSSWQTGGGDRVPAPVHESLPVGVAGDLREKAEDLGIAGRAVAPPEAVPLDDVRAVRRVGVGDQEAVRTGLVPTDDVGCAGQCELQVEGSRSQETDREGLVSGAQRPRGMPEAIQGAVSLSVSARRRCRRGPRQGRCSPRTAAD